MLKHRFDVCLFDLDGTLVDSLPGIGYSFGSALQEVLPGRPAPDIRPFIGPPIRDIFHRALGNSVNSAQLDQLVAAFRRSYDTDGWLRTQPFDGVVEGLERMAALGIPCHVITNKPALATGRILQHLEIADIFCSVVTRESRTPPFGSKTEAALDLAGRLDHEGHRVLLVGDSMDDAEAAHACGFRFAAADYGFGRVSDTAPGLVAFRLSSFAMLLSVVEIPTDIILH